MTNPFASSQNATATAGRKGTARGAGTFAGRGAENDTADHAQTDASAAKDDEAEKDTAEEDGIRTPVYPLVESDAPTSTEKSKKSRAASKKEIPTSETPSLVKKTQQLVRHQILQKTRHTHQSLRRDQVVEGKKWKRHLR